MEENIKNIIDSLQGLEKKIKVKSLSLDSEIDSKPLSFKQQKNILSTIADGSVGILKFQKIINDIILDNTENEELLITDKLPIIMKLRFDSIGSNVKFDDEVVDISKNLQVAESLKFPKLKQVKGSVVVDLKVPTLKEESKVINTAIEFLKRDEQDAGKVIGNMYVFEIVKFIEKIKIGDKELVFSEIPVKDRLKVVESMPLSVNTKIVETIESIKTIENTSLDVEVDGEKKRFDLDVSFFDN